MHFAACAQLSFSLILSSSKRDKPQGDSSGRGHLTPEEGTCTFPRVGPTELVTRVEQGLCFLQNAVGDQLVGAGHEEVVLAQGAQAGCL